MKFKIKPDRFKRVQKFRVEVEFHHTIQGHMLELFLVVL